MQSYMPANLPATLGSFPVGSGPSERTTTVEQVYHAAPLAAQPVLRALVQAQARHHLFLPDHILLVAVSGGADSVCLLHALHQLAPIWGLSLHVAHLDHNLRPDSAEDAAFVAQLAERLSLPLHEQSIFLRSQLDQDDVPSNVEAIARSARYRFLHATAQDLAAHLNAPVTVATGHHQDDQAETVLLHLLQGSGLSGLAGMAWVGELPIPDAPPIRLVRPLLGVTRAEIHAYLHAYGQSWREDSTNHDVTYLRNRLRHQVLPLLATINPNIHATLARTADLLAAEADHATQRDRAALAAMTREGMHQTRIVLDLFHLAQADLATQRGVLRQALLQLGIDLREVGIETIDSLLVRAKDAKPSGPHPLVRGWAWTLLRHPQSGADAGVANALAIHRHQALPMRVAHPHLTTPLATPLLVPFVGTLALGEYSLQSALLPPDALPVGWRDRGQPWRLFCDAAQSGDLYLTTFQAGMSIAPLGMNGQQRMLGDIFTDQKVPPYLRPGWPVIINYTGQVVWLCGLVISDHVRVQPNTRQVRHLYWQLETDTTL